MPLADTSKDYSKKDVDIAGDLGRLGLRSACGG
jgi:hypothetical protein